MTGTDERAQGRAQDPDSAMMRPRHSSDTREAISATMAPEITVALPVVSRSEEQTSGAGASVARHSAVMAVGSIASRVTGFLRTAAIGAAIGVLAIGNDYNLANTLPGMVYELLLGGVLSSVVIPLLVRARTRDADRGAAYAQRLLTMAVVFLLVATIAAVACAPLFAAVLTNDRTAPADQDLIITLSYLLLPMIFFYGMAALFAAVLNTHGHFAMPTFAPILNNLVVIAMMLVFLALPVDSSADAASLSALQVSVLGLGTTLGIVVQAAGLWPALRRVGFRWRWRWDFRELRLPELGRVSAWMLAYVVVSQLGVVVILKLAQMAADNGEDAAGPAIFNNAFLLFMMAHGIVAVSVITALMPRMAAAAAQQRHADLVHQLSLGTRLTAVVLLPATVGYAVLGQPLAISLFEWGNYGHAEAVATGWVIAVSGLGLVPFAVSQLQLFAFYAMPDTKTPALINLPVVALRILIDIGLYLSLPAVAVAAGLMAGNAASFVLAAAVGYLLLRRRIGSLELRRVGATLAQLALAALLAGGPALLTVLGIEALLGVGKLASVVGLVTGGVVLVVGYVAAAVVLRVREVHDLGSMVRTRLGGR